MADRKFVVEPRGLVSWKIRLLVPTLSVVAALVVGAIFLALTGEDPFAVYGQMLDSAFGSARAFSETLITATPLILTGVAAAIAFKIAASTVADETFGGAPSPLRMAKAIAS